jgi:hypothetical protein
VVVPPPLDGRRDQRHEDDGDVELVLEHFVSWTGTAPIDASSGDHVRHSLMKRVARAIWRVQSLIQPRDVTGHDDAHGREDAPRASAICHAKWVGSCGTILPSL